MAFPTAGSKISLGLRKCFASWKEGQDALCTVVAGAAGNEAAIFEARVKRETLLKFAYPTGDDSAWMRNFWLCGDKGDFSTCSGYIRDVASFVASELNMTVQLQMPRNDGSNGRFLVGNDNWTRGITDDTSYCALVPIPNSKKLFYAFIEPFTKSTWIAFIMSFLLLGMFLGSLKHKYYQNFTWLALFGSVVGQDYGERLPNQLIPRNKNKRREELRFWPMAAWHFAITILSISYSTLVIKYFLDQTDEKLADFNDLEKTSLNITYNPTLTEFLEIMESPKNHPTIKAIRKRMNPAGQVNEYYPTKNEAYIDGEAALYLRLDMLKAIGDDAWRKSYVVCERNMLPARYRTPNFHKYFPRLEQARTAVRAFVEHGFEVRLERTYLDQAADNMADIIKNLDNDEVLRPIWLKNVYAWYVGLLAGLAVASLAFALELMHGKCCDKYADDFFEGAEDDLY